MGELVKTLAVKTDNLSSIPGTALWKKRDCSRKLSPDLHTCAYGKPHTHTHIFLNKRHIRGPASFRTKI